MSKSEISIIEHKALIGFKVHEKPCLHDRLRPEARMRDLKHRTSACYKFAKAQPASIGVRKAASSLEENFGRLL